MSAPAYRVIITDSALRDARQIASYLEAEHSVAAAERFFDGVLDRIATLADFPLQGATLKEIAKMDRRGHRQLLSGKYRIIYRVVGQEARIVLIADGRRDMQDLLTRRILASKRT